MATQSKSVFLYWKPTKIKRELITQTQKIYTESINHFIDLMISNDSYYLDLFNNNKKSSLIRSLEKVERYHLLGSAYSQNAIDHAVKELHNHFTRIKNKLFGYCYNKRPELLSYVSSIALLNASILEQDELTVLSKLLVFEIDKEKPSKEKIIYYTDLFIEVMDLTVSQRELFREEVRNMFYEKLESWKVPFVKLAPLQLDKRVFTFENPENVDADKILSIKLIGSKDRVQIPVKTTKNSLRRLFQYKNCSPTITFKNGYIKVSIPFEKKIKEYKTKKLRGTDIGIIDLIYASNGKNYGTFSGMDKFYDEVLQPKFKNRSKLQNKMRQYQKQLKSKTISSVKKQKLRVKIHNIANTLNGKKKLTKCQNKYNHQVSLRLNQAVKPYIQDIKYDKVIPVFESLDITEFDRDKKSNKRDSSWIRGKLMKKLQETLKWNGIPFIEVDPAYTSKCCPNCFNIDNENRKYKKFECTVCNHRDDADHNASINIENRAFDKDLHSIVEKYKYNTKKRHFEIRKLFEVRHKIWLMKNTVSKKSTVVAA